MPIITVGYYPYKVVVTINVGKWSNSYKERDIFAQFTCAADVNDHLLLVRKFNKNWIRIKVFKKGELIKEWQKESIGTLTQ